MTQPKAGSCSVTAIRVGTLTVDKANLLYGEPRGREVVDVPVWCGLIKTEDTYILVDTGIRDPSWVADNNLGSCHQGALDTMTGALGHLGLTCADIQVVINSHLHFDHCANNYLFPQATFLVGDKEWGASRQPVEDQAVLYSAKEWLLEPLTESSYTLVEEDQFEVVPGVRVMKTPGHTPGHQVVLVDTGEGTISIAGDAVNCNENFLRDRPGGIVWDLELAIASLEKIREHSDSVLMAHDVRIADFQEGNFPSVPGPTEVTGGCC